MQSRKGRHARHSSTVRRIGMSLETQSGKCGTSTILRRVKKINYNFIVVLPCSPRKYNPLSDAAAILWRP